VLTLFSLPPLQVHANPGDPTSLLIPNPNYSCTGGLHQPLSGRYLGHDGRVLNVRDFRGAIVDKAATILGLGAPAAVVTPRILQLAVRFRW